ncbi:predicted redox protein, regulator of disulfide bond formation [Hahella chejuensis KCTC 2396]|uniref:Predicted redox protein, regulator of disulfide bond formation n=1 Tax=Hahella chejuensis (strain KCTC 2396) TaxID=349521 RepID=Q2SJR9_HAHCH|nr:sulfurtransferase TusA [Hahella chejuensis]ABC29105.1 predicted redox protein, regulator of disulfide bond formation [Hahella chejuensis KCTC 2396]
MNDSKNENTEYSIDSVMDVCGLFCPEPVMMLHNRINDVEVGCVIEVLATDPSTQRDIPKFCQFLGHELLASGERDKQFFYHIRKAGG